MQEQDMARDDSADEQHSDETTQQELTGEQEAEDNGYDFISTVALRAKSGGKGRKSRYVMTVTKGAREAGIEDGDPIQYTAGVEDGERMLVIGLADESQNHAYQDGPSLRVTVPRPVLEQDLGIDLEQYDSDNAPKFKMYASDGILYFDPVDETVPYANTGSTGVDSSEQSRPRAAVHGVQFNAGMAAALVTISTGDGVREYEVHYIQPSEEGAEPRVETHSEGGPTDRFAAAATHAGLTALGHRDDTITIPSWVGDVDYQFTYASAIDPEHIVQAAHVSGIDPDQLSRLAFDAETNIIETGVLDSITDRIAVNNHEIVHVESGWWQDFVSTLNLDVSQTEVRALERAHMLQAKEMLDDGAEEELESVVAIPSRNNYQ